MHKAYHVVTLVIDYLRDVPDENTRKERQKFPKQKI